MESPSLETLVSHARTQGASDLHLEPGLPPAFRIRGRLQTQGQPVSPETLLGTARAMIGDAPKSPGGRIEIEPVEGGLDDVLKKLQ